MVFSVLLRVDSPPVKRWIGKSPIAQVIVGVVFVSLTLLSSLAAAVEITSVDDCRQLIRDHPENLEAYRCFWMIARRSGNWQASEEALHELLRETPGDPRLQLYLGAILADQDKIESQSVLEQAADGFKALEHARGESYALIALVGELNKRGRMDEAQAYLQRAHKVADESGEQDLIAQAGLTEGWFYIGREEFDDASRILLQVEAALFPDGPYYLQYGTLDALGNIAWATGRYETAIRLHTRSLRLAREQHDVHQAAHAAYNLVVAATRLCGDQDRCEQIESISPDALQAALSSGSRSLEARVRLWIGQPYDGNPQRRQQIVEALKAARSAEDPLIEMAALRGLAQHDAASDPSLWEGARSLARHSLEMALNSDNHEAVIRSYLVLGRVLYETDRRTEAMRACHQAIDEIERLNQRQDTRETAARIASRWAFAFYDLSDELLRGDDFRGNAPEFEEALTVMEQLRGHSRDKLFVQAGAADIDLTAPELSLSLARIQRALAPDEALLSYQLAHVEGTSWVVVVSSDGAEAIPLADRRTIDPAIEITLGLLQHDEPIVADAFTHLAELIFTPALDVLDPDIRKLVIVPDWNLYSVPFAALRPHGGKYLVETHSIEISPSILSWIVWREQPATASSPSVLGIADPSLAKRDATSVENRVAPSTTEVLDLPALPHARKEVQRVCAIVGNNSRGFSRDDATKASLRAAAPLARPILHFATHAMVDGENPGNTALLLAPSGASDDGRLTIVDILNLDHGASLVILNSCRSASGVLLHGRGVLGLTQTFLASGSRTVIGNLWSVDDRSARRLVTALYQNLILGAPVAEALAQAQRRCIQNHDPPLVWASLSVHGDGMLTFAPAKAQMISWSIALVVGLVLLMIVGIVLSCSSRFSRLRRT